MKRSRLILGHDVRVSNGLAFKCPGPVQNDHSKAGTVRLSDVYCTDLLRQIRFVCLLCFSYAARESPSYADYKSRRSSSRSTSPEVKGKVEFITSFGVDSDEDAFKPVLGPVSGASKTGLKRLRELSRTEEVSGRKLKEATVMGPMLPDSLSFEKKSRSVHNFFRFLSQLSFVRISYDFFRFRFANRFYLSTSRQDLH
jgi:hypothetical protein